MSHMKLYTTPAGHLYSADCSRCGATMYVHEHATWDLNEERDAMQAGTLACQECGIGRADPATFVEHKRPHYASRYSADGYMDCTRWEFDTSKRRLQRTVRDLYGN